MKVLLFVAFAVATVEAGPRWWSCWRRSSYSYFETTTATDDASCADDFEAAQDEGRVVDGCFQQDNTLLMTAFNEERELRVCQVKTCGRGDDESNEFEFFNGEAEPLFKFKEAEDDGEDGEDGEDNGTDGEDEGDDAVVP